MLNSFAFAVLPAYDYAPHKDCKKAFVPMTQAPDSGTSLTTLRQKIDDLDTQLHDLLMERARAVSGMAAAAKAAGQDVIAFFPDREADVVRQRVEAHEGALPLATIEHIWRDLITSCNGLDQPFTVHLDGSGDLLGLLDLARFNFGFSTGVEVTGDPADVVGIVAASENDLGIVALIERAEMPWWRGLSDNGAQIIARLPYLVHDERPADTPGFVIARMVSSASVPEIHTYDARWSGVLPGRLMDQGIEVVSFHRSAQGVDALLAVAADLSEEAVLTACQNAGAEPDVLRRVGGYAAPIDVEGEADGEFGFAPDDLQES
ncbi:chorismate mutase [Roseibium sp. TrichSKD4]|uniref:chorismate mutase n=1 Tax=Roseibium sp. TrichSKD4 TaxID=744980 RepID=UPI0001E56808|nr:chorismate mutase [Roseibium sp. TrichSKD4]EFO32394.1 chorismate mutase [Roseibium sp. TrichSKD4]